MTNLFSDQLFSEEWMGALMELWNCNPHIHMPLQKAKFTASIGYGFKGEQYARGVLLVAEGKVQYAGTLDPLHVELDWDLRASRENWVSWIEDGFGVTRLGPAIATNSLEFVKGNYRKMIANLSLGQPFLQHFQLMKEIKTSGYAGVRHKAGKSQKYETVF